MFAVWIVGFAFAVGAEAAVFRYEYRDYPKLELSVGTPAQGPFAFTWHLPLLSTAHEGPVISDKNFGGIFDSNASTTFQPTKSDQLFTYGTDKFTLFGDRHSNMSLLVHKSNDRTGMVDLSPGVAGQSSFLWNMFRALRGDASLAFLIKSKGFKHDGTIIFGDREPSECSSWTRYAALSIGIYRMAFYSKIIEIGSYRRTGLFPTIFHLTTIAVDRQTYAAAIQSLNITNEKIDCAETTEIVIGAADRRFAIGPNDYMKRMRNGECEFGLIQSRENVISLPLTYLYRQCLSYDFEKLTVAIGTLN